ncbi:MAG: hypothetical protein IJE07_13900 [Clostridia bacterium]|nr:hypothetical protein [Clostridia bacterium]
MNNRTFRWERLKSDLADLLLRLRDVLGGLLILLLGVAVVGLNVLDALGVVNHSPLLQKLYWPLIVVSYGVIALILLGVHLLRRRERRAAKEAVRQLKEHPPHH